MDSFCKAIIVGDKLGCDAASSSMQGYGNAGKSDDMALVCSNGVLLVHSGM